MSMGTVLMLAILVTTTAQDEDLKPLLVIAREAISQEVRGVKAQEPKGETPVLPIFVTIERGGKVVGCRGSLQTRTSTLEAEVALAARSAAQHDPRYRPLSVKDLSEFRVTVTVVDGLQPITTVQNLRPEDGLVLTSGDRIGVVLPWEGKDPAVRLKWAYLKAKVPESSVAKLERMSARRLRG